MSRALTVYAAVTLPVLLVGCWSEPSKPTTQSGAYNYYGYGTGSVDVFKDDAESQPTPPAESLPTSLVDYEGNPVDLATYRDKSNLVLVVTRGIPQSPGGIPCPYCVAQVNSLSANKSAFDAREAEVLFLFPGPADLINSFILMASPTKTKLPYPLLLDANMGVCERLGIRGDWAKPSTYVLDKNGNVVYAYVGETLTDRPSLKAILAQLDRIQARDAAKPSEPPQADAVADDTKTTGDAPPSTARDE